MTELSPLSATASAQTPGTRAESASAAPSLIGSDFETFLKMLTTQLKNQDPFDPMDASQFAVQLATFSGVEQQVRTNTLLDGLAQAMGGNDLSRYGTWIGLEAQATGPVAFSGEPITVFPAPRPGADSAQLVVRNAAGSEVARLAVAPDAASLSWAGTDAEGAPLPAGRYSFTTESFANSQPLGADPATSWSRITEIRSTAAGGAVAVFETGAEVEATEIAALRAPAGTASPAEPTPVSP